MLLVTGGAHLSQNQHESVRLYLAALRQEALGTSLPPLRLGPTGKPEFGSGSLHCSLTHTKKGAFCALSDCPVGLDAEPLERVVSPGVAERILTPTEIRQWQNSKNPGLTLLSFWVLKESYVKYTGEGLAKPFSELTFDLDGPRLLGQALRFTLWQEAGHLLALCSPLEENPRFLSLSETALKNP